MQYHKQLIASHIYHEFPFGKDKIMRVPVLILAAMYALLFFPSGLLSNWLFAFLVLFRWEC